MTKRQRVVRLRFWQQWVLANAVGVALGLLVLFLVGDAVNDQLRYVKGDPERTYPQSFDRTGAICSRRGRRRRFWGCRAWVHTVVCAQEADFRNSFVDTNNGAIFVPVTIDSTLLKILDIYRFYFFCSFCVKFCYNN